jgi:hypothetical protein
MGGTNSGRYGGQPTSEACGSYVLSTKQIRPTPGACVIYRLSFGADLFPVLITLDWGVPEYPRATFRHAIRAGDGLDKEYSVVLIRVPCAFGGHRWYWQCPHSGARVFKLFLPRGGHRFLSRKAYRLGYESQRRDAITRMERAKAKLEARLNWDSQGYAMRPRGMRQKTFERLCARWEAADDRCEAAWEPRTFRLLARMMDTA